MNNLYSKSRNNNHNYNNKSIDKIILKINKIIIYQILNKI